MTLQYYDLKKSTIELASLTDNNIELGVKSTLLDITPAFIMPNNNIYYMTTDHYSANFYEEMEYIFRLIGESDNKSTELLSDLKRYIIYLQNDYKRFLNDDICAYDLRNYIDMDCLRVLRYDAYMKDIFSEECKNILTMLLDSKIQVCNYFLRFLNYSKDPIDTLKSYPNAPKVRDYDKIYNKLLENGQNLLNHLPIEYRKNMFDTIEKHIEEERKNKLSHLNDSNFFQDFVVSSIGLDKIETQANKTITTTKLNPYEYYYNYIINGYNIVQLPRIIYDDSVGKFVRIDTNEFSMCSYYDKKYKEEAELINKKVPNYLRYKYYI